MATFMPKVGFSQEKVSRMVKGMPGFLVLNYRNERELLTLLKEVFARKSYKKEPFYLEKCPHHHTRSVFKGKTCLNCKFREQLHPV